MSTMTVLGRVPSWGFGDRVRKIRREEGLSQAEFAAQISVGEKAVAAWESGRTSPQDIVAVAKSIQKAWGWSAAWVAGLAVPPPSDPGAFAGNRLVNAFRWSPTGAPCVTPLPVAA